jgi:hypothetical protein
MFTVLQTGLAAKLVERKAVAGDEFEDDGGLRHQFAADLGVGKLQHDSEFFA